MSSKFSIQSKALFLLIVFMLSTVVGLACSLGVDMGFNHSHQMKEPTSNHSKNNQIIDVIHDHEKSNHDNHSSDTNNCCENGVVKLLKVDKLTPKPFLFSPQPLFSTAFISSFFYFNISALEINIPNHKFFIQSYHPPILKIRIAIQSFQI